MLCGGDEVGAFGGLPGGVDFGGGLLWGAGAGAIGFCGGVVGAPGGVWLGGGL